MSRRPQRLIRLAQHLAVSLGLNIDQDADAMSEDDLRELLNAAIDYVDAMTKREILRSAKDTTYTLPNTTTWPNNQYPPYTWTSGGGGGVTYNSVSSHAHGTGAKQILSYVNES